ncbi:unnamed protein product [Symbiodinium sp. CCMP2592]|nr:unnamed protein product [Symbiodinium sp. CCMP2592]
MRPVFNAYKRLRQEGYQFPRSSTGVAANLCLVNGAENSPAYLAGATPSAGTPAPTIAPAPQPPARPSAEAEDEEIARMIGARADASERVEQLVQALEQGRDFDPQELDELITLVEDISEVLRAMGVEDEDGRPKAPPPSSVPPGAIGVRNVPAARVISESPEGLLIDDTGGASQFEPEESSDRSPSRPSASPEDLGDPLYDAPGSAVRSANLES